VPRGFRVGTEEGSPARRARSPTPTTNVLHPDSSLRYNGIGRLQDAELSGLQLSHATMFDIRFTESALEDIAWFQTRDRRIVFDGIQQQLADEPVVETRNRKTLRPNRTAEWEVRIEAFRVFYDVDIGQQVVDVKVVGRKSGSKVLVRGKEFRL